MAESQARQGGTEFADIRIVTYNVHRCRGLDRRTRPERIADVLAAVDADIIALQEVIGSGTSGAGHAELIGAYLGMGWVMASARELRRHQFGNVVLSRHPIREHAAHDLSWKSCEPRCSQRVAIDIGPGLLQVFNVHLERRCSNAAIKPRGWPRGCTIDAWRCRNSCSATSTSGPAVLRKTCSPTG